MIRFLCGDGRLPTGAPDLLDTKDFFTLLFNYQRSKTTHRTNVLRNTFKCSFKDITQLVVSDNGGGERDRTDGLLRARQALSQLSYTPKLRQTGGPRWT